MSLENVSLQAAWMRRGNVVAIKDKPTAGSGSTDRCDAGLPNHAGRSEIVRSRLHARASRCVRGGRSVSSKRAAQPASLTVSSDFRLEKDSPHVLGRIAVRSAEPCRIAEVCFPLVTLRMPFSGSGETDQILWPECDGTVLRNPSVNRPDRQFRYPGSASLQLMAASRPGGRPLSDQPATGGTLQGFSSPTGKALELSTPISCAHGREAMGIGVPLALADLRPSDRRSVGSLEAACRSNRSRVNPAAVVPKTMAHAMNRSDIPPGHRADDAPDHSSAASWRQSFGNRIPLAADQVERWSKLVGAPITYLIISWEKLDTWTTPDYFPPNGGAGPFAEMTRQLRARGHHTMVFLSGLHWTLRTDQGPVHVDQQADFDRRGRASAISDAKGQAVISGKPEQGVGQSATICPTTPIAREILVGTSDAVRVGDRLRKVDRLSVAKKSRRTSRARPSGRWRHGVSRPFTAVSEFAGKAPAIEFAFSIEEPGSSISLARYRITPGSCTRPLATVGRACWRALLPSYHVYLGYGGRLLCVKRPSTLALFQTAGTV